MYDRIWVKNDIKKKKRWQCYRNSNLLQAIRCAVVVSRTLQYCYIENGEESTDSKCNKNREWETREMGEWTNEGEHSIN